MSFSIIFVIFFTDLTQASTDLDDVNTKFDNLNKSLGELETALDNVQTNLDAAFTSCGGGCTNAPDYNTATTVGIDSSQVRYIFLINHTVIILIIDAGNASNFWYKYLIE